MSAGGENGRVEDGGDEEVEEETQDDMKKKGTFPRGIDVLMRDEAPWMMVSLPITSVGWSDPTPRGRSRQQCRAKCLIYRRTHRPWATTTYQFTEVLPTRCVGINTLTFTCIILYSTEKKYAMGPGAS